MDPVGSSDFELGVQNVDTDRAVPIISNSTEPPEGVGDDGESEPDLPTMTPPSAPLPTDRIPGECAHQLLTTDANL